MKTGRLIYGFTMENDTQVYVNYGESRYEYVDIAEFISKCETLKFYHQINDKEIFRSLDELDIKDVPKSFYYDNKSYKFLQELSCKEKRAFLVKSLEYVKFTSRLAEYKNANGRTWKSKLLNEFENGTNTCPLLQQFRNRYFDLLKKMNKDYFTNAQTIAKHVAKDPDYYN